MGLTRKEDVTEELKSHRMNQNWQDLEKLINGIAETMNPFSGLIGKNSLFNIAASKVAHEETATFLLDCMKDSSSFSRPIKRQKIKNFSTQAGRFKVSSASNKKLVTVTLTKDPFGSILLHALQAKVDMGEVLRYLLTPVLL